jgi:hypothetical protein
MGMCGQSQTVINPADGDKSTGTHHTLDLVAVKLDMSLCPTGGNFYYGDSGGTRVL